MALDDDTLDDASPEERRRHSELRNAIDRIAERAATKAGRAAGRRAAVGYFALIAVALFGAVVYQRSIDHRVYVALDRGCQRLNTLRVKESNQGFQSIWKAFYLARQRADALKRSASDPKIRAANTDASRTIGELTANLKWTPATDCAAFARDPVGYVPPTPRPFTTKFLDLNVVPK